MVVTLGVEEVDDLILKSGRQHVHHGFVIGSTVLVSVLETLDFVVLNGHDQGVLAPVTPVLVRVPNAREMATLHGGIDALGRHRTSVAVSISQGREMSLLGSQHSGDRIPRVAVLTRVVEAADMTRLSRGVSTFTPPIKTKFRVLVWRHEAARVVETVLHGPGQVRDRQLGRLDDCATDAEQGSRVVESLLRHDYALFSNHVFTN